jgi:hypothetical protein
MTLFGEFMYITQDHDDCSGRSLLFLQMFMYTFLVQGVVAFAEIMYLILIGCECVREQGFAKGDFWFGVVTKILMAGQYALVILGTVWLATSGNNCATMFP